MTSADLEKVKAERLEKVKPSTVNRELAFLKDVYNVAIRDGKTERSPFARLSTLLRNYGDIFSHGPGSAPVARKAARPKRQRTYETEY